MPADPCPTCAGVGELEGGRGEPPRVDCPTCCWRLVDGVPYHIPCRALVLLHPHAVVTWGAPSGYAVTGPDGPTHTRSSIAPANLPSVLAAHGCRMPSDAALAWLRGETTSGDDHAR